jgi:hypothetical protein
MLPQILESLSVIISRHLTTERHRYEGSLTRTTAFVTDGTEPSPSAECESISPRLIANEPFLQFPSNIAMRALKMTKSNLTRVLSPVTIQRVLRWKLRDLGCDCRSNWTKSKRVASTERGRIHKQRLDRHQSRVCDATGDFVEFVIVTKSC